MTQPPENSDDTLERVLAGGGLSGPQRERVLEDVLRQSAARRPTRWLVWLGMGLASAGAVAAIALGIGVGKARNPQASATAKGMGAGPVLWARCPGREPGQCLRGDRLVFEVDEAPDGGVVAAFAEGPAGGRIWYFPAADGHLPSIPPGTGHRILGEGIRLGDEHQPGRYSLHLLVLDLPLVTIGLREKLLSGQVPARARAVLPLRVLP